MSDLKNIVVKGNGHFDEVQADDSTAFSPGMNAKINSSGEYVVGLGGSDGARGLVTLVVEDYLLGKTVDDAYSSGDDRVRVYHPNPGDKVLLLVTSGEDIDIGDTLVCDTSTGKWIEEPATGPVTSPFEALEDSGGALGSDTLLLCRYTGQ